jgi:hypothetical protein
MLVDILHVSDYTRVLADAMSDLDSRSLGINYWYGAPWLPARMLTGTRR